MHIADMFLGQMGSRRIAARNMRRGFGAARISGVLRTRRANHEQRQKKPAGEISVWPCDWHRFVSSTRRPGRLEQTRLAVL
jgi:hypothetical protein